MGPTLMKVSVLMPVYNGANSLDAAIRSILVQTLRELELIVVNDGSTDASLQVARSFRDPRVRVIDLPFNQGLINALNTGLSEARGEFLARMDQDDLAHPSRLEQQVAALTTNNAVICGSAIRPFGAIAGQPIEYPLSDASIRAALPVVTPFAHPAVTMRTEVCRRLGYAPEAKHCEDYDLWWRLSTQGLMMNLPEPLLNYRFHAGQISSRHREAQLSGMAAIAATHLEREGRFRRIEDLVMHRKALSYEALNSLGELEAVGDWLQWLKNSFGESGLVVEPHYQRVWRGVCSRQPHLGISTWSVYKRFGFQGANWKTDLMVGLSAFGCISADNPKIKTLRGLLRR